MSNSLFSRLFAPLLCVGVGLGGLFVVAGCSNGGKTALQGEATYGGEPIPLGTITFTPQGDGFRAIQTITDASSIFRRNTASRPAHIPLPSRVTTKRPPTIRIKSPTKCFPTTRRRTRSKRAFRSLSTSR